MVKDFLTDDNNVLIIKDGDFLIGESEEQHLEAILWSEKGHWKETPFLGVGISKAINSSNQIGDIERDILLQLELDEWQNVEVDFSDLADVVVEGTKMTNE
jgi:hypothetical protein